MNCVDCMIIPDLRQLLFDDVSLDCSICHGKCTYEIKENLITEETKGNAND